MNQISFKEQLERHGNETDVRDRMARGLYHGQHLGVAQEWLRRKEEARSVAASASRDAREERMAVAAEVAAAAASRAAKWAMYAAIIATIAMAIAIKDHILALLSP